METIHPAILVGFAICIMLLVGVVFEQYIIKWIKNGVVGVVCIYLCDLLLPVGWHVGINILSVVVVTLLGVPGILLLYLIAVCVK